MIILKKCEISNIWYSRPRKIYAKK